MTSLRSTGSSSDQDSYELIGSSVTSDEIMGGNIQRKPVVDSSSLRSIGSLSNKVSRKLIGSSVTSDEIMGGNVHRNPFAAPLQSPQMDTQDLQKKMKVLSVKEKSRKSKDANKQEMMELAKKEEEIARLKELLEKTTREKNQLEKQVKSQAEKIASPSLLENMTKEIEALKVANGHLNHQLKYEPCPRNFDSCRVVFLTRGLNDKFGFDHIGTSINRVCVGWSASANGVLQGDQIISINGIYVEALAHSEISNILRRVSREAKFVLRYNPERFNDYYNYRNISQYD